MYLSGEELAQTNSSRTRHLHQYYEAGGSLADINQFYWHTHPLLSELELVRSSPPSPPFPLTETLLFESRVTENFDFKKSFFTKYPWLNTESLYAHAEVFNLSITNPNGRQYTHLIGSIASTYLDSNILALHAKLMLHKWEK